MPLGKKYCGGCKQELGISNFVKSKYTKDGLSTQCGECNNKRGDKWRKDNPEKNKETLKKWHNKHPHYERNRNYLRWYGITIDKANELFDNQKGKCAICGIKLKSGRNKTSANLDHCHKTKRIRGFLCLSCNHGLGNFNDDVDLLLKAIKYLKK